MKIICSDPPYLLPKFLEELRQFDDIKIYEDFPKDSEDLKSRIIEAEVLIVDPMTKIYNSDVLSVARNLKVIITTSVGIDHIDSDYCNEHSIKIINFPGYNANSVAEHTLALLLSLIRKVTISNQNVKSGGWKQENLEGEELTGKVLGLVGAGNIGSRIAEIVKNAFEMKVFAYTKNPSSTRATTMGIDDFKPLEEVVSESDFLVLALPDNDETHHLLNREVLSKLKKSAYLVNVGRGGVIDTEALAELINLNKIKGAAIDVIENEPFELSNASDTIKKMIQNDNLIITAHVAGSTMDANVRLGERLISELKQLTNGSN